MQAASSSNSSNSFKYKYSHFFRSRVGDSSTACSHQSGTVFPVHRTPCECSATASSDNCLVGSAPVRPAIPESVLPPADQVYNQFKHPGQNFNVQPILSKFKDHVIPRTFVVPGTEINPNASIYGYNENQTLDVTGGVAKSYNPEFQQINYRYHGENPTVNSATDTNMLNAFQRTFSWFIQRGMQIPNIDVYPQQKGLFVLNTVTLQYISAQFHYRECDDDIPQALDLIATVSENILNYFGTGVSTQSFEPCAEARKNAQWYPIRIPITTKFKTFERRTFEGQSSVFYDEIQHSITIHVATTATTTYRLVQTITYLPQYEIDINLNDNLVQFDGTFTLSNETVLII